MGLILKARCAGCGFLLEGLRLGGTHEQISAHDVSHEEVFAAPCCGSLQSVRVYLGQPYPTALCSSCARPLRLDADTRYRISTLKGEVYEGHPCPRCAERSLSFEPTGSFL